MLFVINILPIACSSARSEILPYKLCSQTNVVHPSKTLTDQTCLRLQLSKSKNISVVLGVMLSTLAVGFTDASTAMYLVAMCQFMLINS